MKSSCIDEQNHCIHEEILTWHKETFPNATEEAVADKLLEEIDELWSAISTYSISLSLKDECNVLDELADVFIVGARYIDIRSDGRVSLVDVIRKKLNRNRLRTWGEETANGDRPRVK